jgi:hypothetical protein
VWANFAACALKNCNYIGRLDRVPGFYHAPGCIHKSGISSLRLARE